MKGIRSDDGDGDEDDDDDDDDDGGDDDDDDNNPDADRSEGAGGAILNTPQMRIGAKAGGRERRNAESRTANLIRMTRHTKQCREQETRNPGRPTPSNVP